jgi:hypothetical protein
MTKRHRLRRVATWVAAAVGVFALAGRADADSLELLRASADAVTQAAGQEQQNQREPQDQQTGQNGQTQPAQAQAGQQTRNGAGQSSQSGTSNGRLFYAMPNFLTVGNSASLPPLTVKQKFAVVARGAFDYFEYPWYGALAGIGQAENSEPGYGQGVEGYAKRYGAEFADGTIENFWTSAIMPSVLHEDPRFYQMPAGTFTHRAVYAGSRIFITRTDSGHRQFNFSEIFGSLFAAFISTYSYHPRMEHTVGNSLSVWGSEVGYDTITIEVKEFWPDIQKKFSHKKNDPPAGTP